LKDLLQGNRPYLIPHTYEKLLLTLRLGDEWMPVPKGTLAEQPADFVEDLLICREVQEEMLKQQFRGR
jgi:hypothetical protein